MGYSYVKQCIFTGETTEPIINSIAAVEYYVTVNGVRHLIRYVHLNTEDSFIKLNKHVLFALLFNNDWFEDETILITIELLKNLVNSKVLPRTPEDKLETVFLKLFGNQEEDGQIIESDTDFYDSTLWKILYFKSVEELNYYVEVLHSRGLIDASFEKGKERYGRLEKYRITFEGLSFEVKLKQEGDKSNKCFIAMAFKPETTEIRQVIKEALFETGFIPILIDEQNIESDKTINDEILANLKRCKFCIADFTFHSPGVYFESGHALGQGKKVIYTCRRDEFSKAHFDIKPLQHIIYDNVDQLKRSLVNKIKAWVK